MSDHAQNLRQAADEIRREGHAGWGNTCEWAADELERLTAERDNARERFELTANLLMSIHALLYPPPVTLPDGRTFVFRPEDPDPHTVLQTLSDRIRALPDEIAAINDAKEQR